MPAIDTLLGSKKFAKTTHIRLYFFDSIHTCTPMKADTFWKDGSLSSDLHSLIYSPIRWCILWDWLPKQHIKESPYIIVMPICSYFFLYFYIREGKGNGSQMFSIDSNFCPFTHESMRNEQAWRENDVQASSSSQRAWSPC